MREQLERRRKALKAEFEAGQRMLAELEAKQASVRETMLRISGAIQVLEELLAGVGSEGADGAGSLEEPRQDHGPSVEGAPSQAARDGALASTDREGAP